MPKTTITNAMKADTKILLAAGLSVMMLAGCSSSSSNDSQDNGGGDNSQSGPQVSSADISGLWLVQSQAKGRLDGSPEHGALSGELQGAMQAVYRIEAAESGFRMSLCAGDYAEQPLALVVDGNDLRVDGQSIGQIEQNTRIIFSQDFSEKLISETINQALFDGKSSANSTDLFAALEPSGNGQKVRDNYASGFATISINGENYSANCLSQSNVQFENSAKKINMAQLILVDHQQQNANFKAEFNWSGDQTQQTSFAEVLASGEQLLVGNPKQPLPQASLADYRYQLASEFSVNGQFTDQLSVDLNLIAPVAAQ